jgi:two-component system, chemotaxis family, sensor kinase CheA
MWNLVHKIRHLGVSERTDARLGRRIVLLNTVALTLAAVTLPYPLIFSLGGSPALAGTCALAIVLYSAVIVLAATISFGVARLALFTIFPLVLFVVANLMGARSGVQMVFFVSVCLPLLLCDIEERGPLAYGIGVTAVTFLVAEITDCSALGPPFLGALVQDSVRYTIVPVVFIVLITAILHFAVLSRRAERRLDERNRELRVVLDHVDQGLLTITPDGRLLSERSAAADRWLGNPAEGASLVDIARPYDARFADWLALGLGGLADGLLPVEVSLDQLPKQLKVGDHVFAAGYKLIEGAGGSMLVMLTDVTDVLARERADETQKETVALVTRALADRGIVRAFLDEAQRLVTRITSGASLARGVDELARDVHTLKGNAALFGLGSLARLCHELETDASERGWRASNPALDVLSARFEEVTAPILLLLGAGSGPDVSPDDIARLRALVLSGAAAAVIVAELDAWSLAPVERRLSLLAEQARGLAQRLGRGDLEASVDARGVRVEPVRWAPIWSALAHVVRNAVDHGMEELHERLAAGKQPKTSLRLSARDEPGTVVLEIRDDGRGVDWESVAAKARTRGLASNSHADLVAALFTDGVSTRDDVTEISGRGVGLAAVRAACQSLGAQIEVESLLGHGTAFVFRVPVPLRASVRPLAGVAASA